jgi:hypothetical protein
VRAAIAAAQRYDDVGRAAHQIASRDDLHFSEILL